MDALAGADAKMVLAMGADFEVLVQLLVEDHGAALGALGPEALGDFALLGFAAEFGFLSKRGGVAARRRRSDRRLSRFQAQGLFVEGGGGHFSQVESLWSRVEGRRHRTSNLEP